MRAGVGGAAWTWPYKTAYAKNRNMRGERNGSIGAESEAGTVNHSDSDSTQLKGKYILTIV